MSVNWIGIYRDVSGCKNWKEIEEFLVKMNVERGDVLRVVKSSLSHYGYGRDYRSKRNSSMSELKRENERLRKDLEGVKSIG
jgi:hypothetical protein